MAASPTGAQSFSIVILGETGTGKSQLASALTNSDEFPVSASADSCTLKTTCCDMKWENYDVMVYDTPGLDDTAGRDMAHIIDMTQALKEVEDCRAFILTFNTNAVKITGSMRSSIEYFQSMFGELFWTRVIFVGTMAFKRSLKQDEHKASEMRRVVGAILGERQYPVFFIDNDPDGDLDDRGINNILAACASQETVSLSDTRAISTKEQKLKEEKAVLDAQVAAAKTATEKAEAERRKFEKEKDIAEAEVERLKKTQTENVRYVVRRVVAPSPFDMSALYGAMPLGGGGGYGGGGFGGGFGGGGGSYGGGGGGFPGPARRDGNADMRYAANKAYYRR